MQPTLERALDGRLASTRLPSKLPRTSGGFRGTDDRLSTI